MCAEKVQRFLMGIVLTVALVLFYMGETTFGMILQAFVIVMVFVWAVTDFCPSLWFFKKTIGSCDDACDDKKEQR